MRLRRCSRALRAPERGPTGGLMITRILNLALPGLCIIACLTSPRSALGAPQSGPQAAAQSAPQSPQVTYVFKQNYTPGKEYTILFSDLVDLKYDILHRGRAIDEASVMVSRQIKGKVTIVEVKDGLPV